MAKRTNDVSKPKLFIEELELPQSAESYATTLAIGEECGGVIPGKVTTEAVGEECWKAKLKQR